MVGGEARLEEHVLPVSIHGALFSPVGFVGSVLEFVGIFAQFGKLLGIHHGVAVEQGLESHVAIIRHCGSLLLITFVCRDDNHTVGTTRTVDGSGRSILQNVHRLDVVGVYIVDATGKGNTVEHDEPVVAGRKRARTTNTYLHGSTRLRRSLRHLYAGHTTLQGVGNIRTGHLAQQVAPHVSHRTGDSLLALRTVTNDNHVVKILSFSFKLYLQIALAAHIDGLRHISYIRDDQGGTRLNVQCEVTVHIRYSAITCTFFHNRSADERTFAIAHHAGYLLLLLLSGLNRLGQPSDCHCLRAVSKREG